jgi:ubiquinol-cytochrome c reductase cytochrome b subunit
MRILKNHPILRLLNSYLIDASQPSNISYLWNFGSLLACCLVIQIITGVTLAMHFNASVLDAFNSIEHIMRDVNNGWLIRYLHANTASAFFFLVYLHIARGIYYGSYKNPRSLVWIIGTVIFIVMIATAFLGYVLPYGQMSLWGATVITNLMSAIPWIGVNIVEFIWGGFSVNNATLNRFFSLHYVLPFILAVLVLLHLISLHDKAGSGNPLGIGNYVDRLTFSPYYIFKDLITIFIFIFVLSGLVCFSPNLLGDSENYVMANPMQTPPAIVPEWYLLPFYAILRSIPNKLLGVIAMFSAILIIMSMIFLDVNRTRGFQYRPYNKIAFYFFCATFIGLMVLGAKHVESPFIEIGQTLTVIYFCYFLSIIPIMSFFENFIIVLDLKKDKIKSTYESDSVRTYSTNAVSNNFLLNTYNDLKSFLLYRKINCVWILHLLATFRYKQLIFPAFIIAFNAFLSFNLVCVMLNAFEPFDIATYMQFSTSVLNNLENLLMDSENGDSGSTNGDQNENNSGSSNGGDPDNGDFIIADNNSISGSQEDNLGDQDSAMGSMDSGSEEDFCGCSHQGDSHASSNCIHDVAPARDTDTLSCCICGLSDPNIECVRDICACLFHSDCYSNNESNNT